jgi:transcriptional regulator with XRE-family HTH domain
MSGGYAPIAITPDVATSHATRSVGSQIAALRKQVGLSQRGGRRAGLSQAMVSLVETEQVRDQTFRTAERLLSAIGARLVVAVDAPFLADRERQLEPAHARCSAHVVARLRRSGWETRTEVEVGGDRSRGWIDVLAFHPGMGVLLVIEIKTEIRDFGAIERAIGWYERAGPPASRRFGWRPQAVQGCLLLLATQANDARATMARESFEVGFPIRARALEGLIAGTTPPTREGRGVAMIDPRSRRRGWLRPMRIDGRRTPAPYVDYADFMRAIEPDRRRHS